MEQNLQTPDPFKTPQPSHKKTLAQKIIGLLYGILLVPIIAFIGAVLQPFGGPIIAIIILIAVIIFMFVKKMPWIAFGIILCIMTITGFFIFSPCCIFDFCPINFGYVSDCSKYFFH